MLCLVRTTILIHHSQLTTPGPFGREIRFGDVDDWLKKLGKRYKLDTVITEWLISLYMISRGMTLMEEQISLFDKTRELLLEPFKSASEKTAPATAVAALDSPQVTGTLAVDETHADDRQSPRDASQSLRQLSASRISHTEVSAVQRPTYGVKHAIYIPAPPLPPLPAAENAFIGDSEQKAQKESEDRRNNAAFVEGPGSPTAMPTPSELQEVGANVSTDELNSRGPTMNRSVENGRAVKEAPSLEKRIDLLRTIEATRVMPQAPPPHALDSLVDSVGNLVTQETVSLQSYSSHTFYSSSASKETNFNRPKVIMTSLSSMRY